MTRVLLLSILLPLLLLLSSSPLTLSRSPPLDYSHLRIASVTADDGSCSAAAIDSVPTVTDCTTPARLTVFVSGFPANSTPPHLLLLRFASPTLHTSSRATLTSPQTPTPSPSSLIPYSLTFTLPGYDPPTPHPPSPFTLSILHRPSNTTSHPLPAAFSLSPLLPPTFSHISGCAGEGSATLRCVPDRDELTIHGTGFHLFTKLPSFALSLGSPFPPPSLSPSSLSLSSVGSPFLLNPRVHVSANGTMMTIPLSSSSPFLAQPFSPHANTTVPLPPLPLTFHLPAFPHSQHALTHHSVPTTLSLSFTPSSQPPPSLPFFTILAPVVQHAVGCTLPPNGTTEGLRLITCVPELSHAIVNGSYMQGVNLTLTAAGKGEYRVVLVDIQPGYGQTFMMHVIFPLIEEDEPGLAWDLVATTVAGRGAAVGAITFATQPLIVGVQSCATYFPPSTFNWVACTVGSTLTIRGINFPITSTPTAQVTADAYFAQPTNVTLQSVTLISKNLATAVVPQLSPAQGTALYGTTSFVRLFFALPGQPVPLTCASPSMHTLAFPDPPVITAVSGCEANSGPLSVVRCRGGSVLTLQGSQLDRGTTDLSWLSSMWSGTPCRTPVNMTNTVAVQYCLLPNDTRGAQEGVQYSVWLRQQRGKIPFLASTFAAPPFSVSWTYLPYVPPVVPVTPPSDDGESTKGSDATVLLAGVLVPVLLVAAVVVAWLLRRRALMLKGQWGGWGRMRSLRAAARQREESSRHMEM